MIAVRSRLRWARWPAGCASFVAAIPLMVLAAESLADERWAAGGTRGAITLLLLAFAGVCLRPLIDPSWPSKGLTIAEIDDLRLLLANDLVDEAVAQVTTFHSWRRETSAKAAGALGATSLSLLASLFSNDVVEAQAPLVVVSAIITALVGACMLARASRSLATERLDLLVLLTPNSGGSTP